MVKVQRSIYTRTRSRTNKTTARSYEYFRWNIFETKTGAKQKRLQGVALLRAVICRSVSRLDVYKRKFTGLTDCEQTINARVEFVRWIKQPRKSQSLTRLLCAEDSNLANASLQVSLECIYVDVLTNILKAYDCPPYKPTPRQVRFFDNLAAALLQKTIKETTGDLDVPMALCACGSLARQERDTDKLSQYYQRLGFCRESPKSVDDDDSDGISMKSNTAEFFEKVKVEVDNRWQDLDGPTMTIRKQK